LLLLGEVYARTAFIGRKKFRPYFLSTTTMEIDNRLRIKGGKKEQCYGFIIGWIIKLISLTIRCRVYDPHHACRLPQPFIISFWHGDLLTTTIAWDKATSRPNSMSCLTSSSRDGAIIAAFMECFQVSSIRGSSSRRGLTALLQLKNTLLQGSDIAITPDGPRGPAQEIQGGALKLAQLTGNPIVPFTIDSSSTWKLSTWDSFRIPRPFSSIHIHLHAPVYVPRRADEMALEAIRESLQITLSQTHISH
jgi:lysophospholipid acyltransferase (LPLAT)-like uncharacterized protein